MELLTVVLVSVVVVSALGLLVVFGVLAVRWARKNRAAAARALLEVQMAGIPPPDVDIGTGWWDSFTSWLGDQVDSASDSASLDCGGHDGGDFDGGDGDCD